MIYDAIKINLRMFIDYLANRIILVVFLVAYKQYSMLDHYHIALFTPIMVHSLTVPDEDTSDDFNEDAQ